MTTTTTVPFRRLFFAAGYACAAVLVLSASAFGGARGRGGADADAAALGGTNSISDAGEGAGAESGAGGAPAGLGGGFAGGTSRPRRRRRRRRQLLSSANVFRPRDNQDEEEEDEEDERDEDTECYGLAQPIPNTYCGRGPDRADCADDQYCHVHPTDRFAVCCPNEEAPSAPSKKRKKKVARCLRRKRREGQKYLGCGLRYTRANMEDAEDDREKGKNNKDRMKQCEQTIKGTSAFATAGGKRRFKKKKKCIDGGVTPETMDQILDLCLSTGLGGKECKKFGRKFVDYSAGRRFDMSGTPETATTTTTTARPKTTTTTAAPDDGDEVVIGPGGPDPVARMAPGMPFVPWHVNDFDADVVNGYTDCPSFEYDLEQAFRMLADSVICNHVKGWDDRLKRTYVTYESEPLAEALDDMADATEADGDAGGDEPEGEDSFLTNTQEEDVDEGDILKVREDGKVVFAAYGDLLLCWDADSGEMTCRMKMPVTKKLDGEPKGKRGWHYYSSDRANILSLLIYKERLVVVVDTGYRGHWCWYCFHPMAEEGGEGSDDDKELESLLSDHGAVQIRIYNISDESIPGADVMASSSPADDEEATGLPLLGASLLQGYPMAYRSIGRAAHVVTSSDVRIHLFTDELSPWNEQYQEYDDNVTAYAEAASARAEELAPKFAAKLAEEVLGEGGECSDDIRVSIAKISSFGMASSSDDTSSCDGGAEDHFLSQTGLLNKFVRVNSFDISGDPPIVPPPPETRRSLNAEEEPPRWNVSVAGTFLPTHWAEVYSSSTTIVLGGRLYRRVGGPWPFGTYEDSTFLLAFLLSDDGSAATGLGAGTVPGYTLNRYAFDEQEGYLRVATTSSRKTTCGKYKNYTYERCTEYKEEEGEEVGDAEDAIFWWHPGVCVTWSNYTYQRCTKWKTLSNSTSQITVLDLPMTEEERIETGGRMSIVANVTNLGPTEVIHAVRFFPTRAFVVTFQLTDPLYSIDFSNNTNPKLADELKITGFGRYLHPVPMNDEEYLLAVGQEADPTNGRPTGLQVSLFNVTDLYNISMLTRYTVESSDSAYSSSAAEFDPHAFRYLPKSQWLLLPAQVRDYKNPQGMFDGFIVFEIGPEEIAQKFNVSMADPDYIYGGGCYYRAWMPPRTLVFKGDATFIKSHSYRSIDLETEEPRWNKSLDEYMNEDDCEPCYWFGMC